MQQIDAEYQRYVGKYKMFNKEAPLVIEKDKNGKYWIIGIHLDTIGQLAKDGVVKVKIPKFVSGFRHIDKIVQINLFGHRYSMNQGIEYLEQSDITDELLNQYRDAAAIEAKAMEEFENRISNIEVNLQAGEIEHRKQTNEQESTAKEIKIKSVKLDLHDGRFMNVVMYDDQFDISILRKWLDTNHNIQGDVTVDFIFDGNNIPLEGTFYKMFSFCELRSLTFRNFDARKITDFQRMFDTQFITSIDFSGIESREIHNTDMMFRQQEVADIDISNLNMSSLKQANLMFDYAKAKSIRLPKIKPNPQIVLAIDNLKPREDMTKKEFEEVVLKDLQCNLDRMFEHCVHMRKLNIAEAIDIEDLKYFSSQQMFVQTMFRNIGLRKYLETVRDKAQAKTNNDDKQ